MELGGDYSAIFTRTRSVVRLACLYLYEEISPLSLLYDRIYGAIYNRFKQSEKLKHYQQIQRKVTSRHLWEWHGTRTQSSRRASPRMCMSTWQRKSVRWWILASKRSELVLRNREGNVLDSAANSVTQMGIDHTMHWRCWFAFSFEPLAWPANQSYDLKLWPLRGPAWLILTQMLIQSEYKWRLHSNHVGKEAGATKCSVPQPGSSDITRG